MSVDVRLSEAATAQARTVAEAGTLSHGQFSSRMSALGINGHAAENLSAGSRTVDQVIARWEASPGHNENFSCRKRGGSVWRGLSSRGWGTAATGRWCWPSKEPPSSVTLAGWTSKASSRSASARGTLAANARTAEDEEP